VYSARFGELRGHLQGGTYKNTIILTKLTEPFHNYE